VSRERRRAAYKLIGFRVSLFLLRLEKEYGLVLGQALKLAEPGVLP